MKSFLRLLPLLAIAAFFFVATPAAHATYQCNYGGDPYGTTCEDYEGCDGSCEIYPDPITGALPLICTSWCVPPATCPDGWSGTPPDCSPPPPPPSTCADMGFNAGTPPDCYNVCDNGSAGPYPSCPLAPVCVAYAGNTCWGSPNACGEASSGAYDCDGNCSAGGPPAPTDQCADAGLQCSVLECAPVCVAYQGQECNTNACGVSGGTYQCDGSCSGSVPAAVDQCVDPGFQCDVSECAPPAYPDLTADPITPTVATAGVATTFTLPVRNGGDAQSPVFNSMLQRATNAVGAGATQIAGVSSTGSLAARLRSLFAMLIPTVFAAAGGPIAPNGGLGRATFSYTFPAGDAGTVVYVRGCADKSSAADANGTVSESNENNNCGTWTGVTVVPATPSVACSPATQSISDGGTANWSATGTNGAGPTYRWYDAFGTLLGTGSAFAKSYGAPGTYAVYVTGSDGAGGTVQSISCTVTVGSGCANQGPVSVTASPSRLQSGVSTSVTFTVNGMNVNGGDCTLTGPGVNQTYTPSSCTVSGTYTTSLSITDQSTYTLSCPGSQSARVILNTVPRTSEF